MQPDDLIAEAQAAAGVDDLGDESFREGLAVLCDALDGEAQLNDFGALAVRAQVVGALVNRLKVLDLAARDQSVTRERVERPLIVIGMFRAGTTLLSRLLDQDPGNRALLSWESADSVPPPTPEHHRAGPRVDAVRAGQAMLSQINPAIDTVHHEDAAEATECLSLLGQDFKSLLWEAVANVPTYGTWLREVDQRSAYEYHRTVLQVLQHGGVRGRWTLKSPHHAIALDALHAIYPEARLVLLHRDPLALCGSVCSLIHTLSGTFTDADHRRYIGRHWSDLLELSIERIGAFRDRHPEVEVIDVHYADLVGDPVGTVRGIYEAAGGELDRASAERMAAHVAANPKGRFGSHRYDVREFGLDAGEVAERFSGYADRYGVVLEQAPA